MRTENIMSISKRPVILITGATRNIGYAVAERFAKEGYNVAITSRKKDAAEKSAMEIEKKYPEISAKGYSMETNKIDSIRAVFADIKENFGRLDVFVPNATDPGYNQSILSTTPEQFDFVMSCNAKGYFFCCQEAAKLMIERKKGSIVAIGSVHSKGAIPNRITYAMSKGAIDVMVRNMCYELGKFGIRSNVIIVGATFNDRWEGMTEEDYAKKRANWPVGMESYPEDIANAVYFAGSDMSKTMSGASLLIDSGVMSCMLSYDKDWDNKFDDRAYKMK